jgi:type VI secretion system secreted protein VgrG
MPDSDDGSRRALQALQQSEGRQATQRSEQAGQATRQAPDEDEQAMGPMEALAEVAQAVVGGLKPLERVSFRFRSSADPDGGWRVVGLRGHEGLSELYMCTLDLANEELGADVEGLLGSSAEVLISRDANPHRLCGIIHRVEHTGTQAGQLLARVHLVPALWALSQRKDCYIFQGQTVPQILQELLTEGLQPFERSFRLELSREYLPREYCVQYQETDLDLALRLMEEEGIFFYFDQSGEKEQLVLVESNEQCPACEPANGTPISVLGPEADTAEDESLRHFDFVQQLHTTSVVVRDFDWTHPDYDLTREARAQDALGKDRESYEYPAPLLGPYDAGAKRYKYEPAQKQEELRRQAFQARGKQGRGEGYVTGFMAGGVFALKGHGNPALDQRYLLTRVEHFGHAPEELTSDSHPRGKEGAVQERYRNTFECIPLDVPFRPERRHPRARMSGLQTATVVGPAGEEVFTDEHGRIKVQFHWDRAGQKDEKSSCFLRVAQVWSGLGWGFVFLPRIGMEVLVDFLEGDPDRPLVTGCVYNGKNTPPDALPDQKTRSTIRTSSTPGGEGFNELHFEDASGSEEVFIHAQKDFTEVVLNDHSTQVKANQTNSVGGSQTETVGGAQTLSVQGQRTKTVSQDETSTIQGKRTETVEQDETITIKATRTEDVTGQEKLTLNAGRDTTVNTLEKLLVTGNREENINGDDTLTVTGGKTDHVTNGYIMTGDQQVQAKQGEVSVTLKDSILVEGSSKRVMLHNSSGEVVLDGDKAEVKATSELSLVCGDASITLKSDGTITINGAKEVHLEALSSALKLDALGGTLSGPKLKSLATDENEITGKPIKLN